MKQKQLGYKNIEEFVEHNINSQTIFIDMFHSLILQKNIKILNNSFFVVYFTDLTNFESLYSYVL